ncbi:YjjG family noncanonical pyrimidine nucleotidase [Silvanigrella aquatica]|uniref:Noncanonical pyrimidine nucleotidase, YjjG family n=1 Tax=Silvanigrella aquatica TaxID=1915309 RepID=A0A1L4D3I8_9BACT|nr:YjjG family noncanonical pyrimidine nucleotidase [Silvanigrella aquatica]APJ04776.1 noncanonical pyrimidine nucleotidase, YjjG family [Silvanigrella aquatica]
MKYSLIFFDADDTLFDFNKSQEIAFRDTVAHFKINYHIESLFSEYKQSNKELWSALEGGTVGLQDLRTLRFKKIFDAHKIHSDPNDAGNYYLQKLSECTHLLPNAVTICQFLKTAGVKIGIITNGYSDVQKKRLMKSELHPFLDTITISEDTGFRKPQPQIFELALNQFKEIPKNKVLMVGDNIVADIQGAQQFGFDTCWFNKRGGKLKNDIEPTYCISELIHIKKILN